MFLKLPPPPSLEELQRSIPRIDPVAEGPPRPFWSVMVPTYNRSRYLRKTLESVLSQDPGPAEMEIEVVDNCSSEGDPEAIVREVGKGRVRFYRQASNLGMTANWNTCIQRARGQWVHLLHDDDMVMPGFYDAYHQAILNHPQAVLVAGKVVTIDEEDRRNGTYGLASLGGDGVFPDFAKRQALENQTACPSVVAKRSAYEQVGGFCTFFSFVPDMDMWFRIAGVGPVAVVSQPYSLYRIHAASDTSKWMRSGHNIYETILLVQANLAKLGDKPDTEAWRSKLARMAEGSAWRLDAAGMFDGRYNQARWVYALEPGWRSLRFLAKSWLKYRLHQLRR